MLGEGSVPQTPRPGSSSPAGRSRLLPSPTPGGTAATRWWYFLWVPSILYHQSHVFPHVSPLPVACANLNCPNEFRKIGAFAPAADLCGTGM